MAYNAQWAKENISMPELLSCFGHEPVESRYNGRELWYISPFRYEKEPSFHTTHKYGKWIWNDFGRSDVEWNGTVIGFFRTARKCRCKRGFANPKKFIST